MLRVVNRQSHAGALPQLYQRPFHSFHPGRLSLLVTVIIILGLLFPFVALPKSPELAQSQPQEKWNSYTLREAVQSVAQNNTVIVCAVSQPYLPFLNNWLISIQRHGRQHGVLVIAEDYATLYTVNERWPGHAVLVPPAPALQHAHRFGSQGFFNFTSRRPRHLLQILELGYSVLYNDVDMVWLKDPFPYFKGNYDIYFTDDMATVKPHDHPHALPAPGKNGRTYICSCMLFIRPTPGGKRILKKWIKEVKAQPWSPKVKTNDQPAFNWALNKTASKVNLYVLPQQAFPSGGLYFKNETWRNETQEKHVIIHNNYITGFEKKIHRFHEFKLWFVDDNDLNSTLQKLGLNKK